MSHPSHLRQLVAAKRDGSPPLSAEATALGFKGWHQRGRLPHYDAPGVIQFITYRLADSMPLALRHVWEPLERIADPRERATKLEAFLDAGHGTCHLRDPRAAAVIEGNLLHHDGNGYLLLAWCVMPNHVHVVVQVRNTPLNQILHAWKSYTASHINKLLTRRGQLWQEEYYDRFIRDRDHLGRAIRYTENNPNKVQLCAAPADWPWGSARLRVARAALPARRDGFILTADELTRRINEAEPASALLKLRLEAEGAPNS